MPKEPRYDLISGEINETQVAALFDNRKRKSALQRLEKLAGGNRVALYYMTVDRSLSRTDILPFGNMLKSIGTSKNLDLIIVSQGGDGTAAETIVDLVRKYCSEKLRIVVPLYAKSAATLMALSGDQIVMGETSELGPIDAQVGIIEGNAVQQVSADHFLRARDDAAAQLASPDEHEVRAAEIQLALLNPAFLKFCEDAMQFGRDFAAKQLCAHMFRQEWQADCHTWEERVAKIVENLTSSSRHLTHGRMITSQDILSDDELRHLKITELGSNEPYWQALSELLARTEIVAHKNGLGKILFARDYQMFGE